MKRQCFAIAVAALMSGPASGQDDPELTIKIDNNDLTDQFMTFLGEYGEPDTVSVFTPQTVGDVVTAQCGSVAENFALAVVVANKDPALSFATALDPGQKLLLPPCPPKPAFELAKVASLNWNNNVAWNSGVEFFARDNLGFEKFDVQRDNGEVLGDWLATNNHPGPLGPFDWSNLVPIARQPGTEIPDSNFGDYASLFRNLNLKAAQTGAATPGMVVVPLTTSQWFSIPLKKEDAAAIAALNTAELSEQIGADISQSDDPDTFTLVGETDASCAGVPFETKMSESAALAALLAENASRLARTGGPGEAHILLFDSGFYNDPADPILPQGMIAASDGLFEAFNYAPIPEMKSDAGHGTKVGFLALGGPPLYGVMRVLGYRTQLHPVRIFRTPKLLFVDGMPVIGTDGVQLHESDVPVDKDVILNQLSKSENAIINMSLGRAKPVGELESVLNNKKALVVVAAGNRGLSLELDQNAVYPARYGGVGHLGGATLITVAATDGTGQLASYSNYGPSFVEIAASGCAVPTVGYDVDAKTFTPAFADGTSFAAPQVTAVAALLKSTLPSLKASDIKLRILASADLVPALVGKVTDGRLLNPLKALAVFEDTIELARPVDDLPAGVVLRGRFDAPPTAPGLCADEQLTGGVLLKVVPHPLATGGEADGDKGLLYLRDQDGFLKRSECPIRSNAVWTFRASLDGSLHDLSIDDIADFVPALATPN